MKIIVAGGRDYTMTNLDLSVLSSFANELEMTELVSGHAEGVDKRAESWARVRKIPIKTFPAQWKRFGKSAGYMRNRDMARYADALLAFFGGRGTDNMVNVAREHNIIVRDFRELPLITKELKQVNKKFDVFHWLMRPNTNLGRDRPIDYIAGELSSNILDLIKTMEKRK